MLVADKVAIVTGAGAGIGAAIAQRLVEAGARVVVTDLQAERVHQVAKELDAIRPGAAIGLAADVSDAADIQRSIDAAAEAWGPVDLYVANAGIGQGVGLDATEDDWHRVLEVNVLAHVRAAKLLVPAWLERGAGYFLVTASAAGLLTQIGSATYSVSKHGAVAFAEWLSITYGDRGIAVSCLCPMGVKTAGLTGASDASDAVVRQAAKAVTDSGRVLEPLDVADSVMEAIGDERFLVLPHAEVLEFWRRKTSDYDRWLKGMRRYQNSLA
jgi:NAD(P)-dependent dehydrogenase (short-subunit alcohol dehydrogenase family)